MLQPLPKFDNNDGYNIPNTIKNATHGYLADGGQVGEPELTTFDGPGTGTSDSIPAELPERGFVITAAAMQMFGSEFFKRLIDAVPAEPDGEEMGEEHMEVRVSDGEGYIPPEVVEFYGSEFFDKINATVSGDAPENSSEVEDEIQKPMVGETEGYAGGGVLDVDPRNFKEQVLSKASKKIFPKLGATEVDVINDARGVANNMANRDDFQHPEYKGKLQKMFPDPSKPMFKDGGCVKKYAVGGYLKDEEARNGPLTQPQPNPITPTPTGGPTVDRLAPQASTDRNVLNSQASNLDTTSTINKNPIVGGDNPQARTELGSGVAQGVGAVAQGSENLMRGAGNLVDSAGTGFSKIGNALNPIDAAQGIAKNVGNLVAGSDNIERINANPAVGQFKSNLEAAGSAAWEGAKERATMGNGLVGLAAAPINAAQKGIQAFGDNDQYQKTIAAEAARNDFNSPSFAGDPRNSPDYNNPADVARMIKTQAPTKVLQTSENKNSLVGGASEQPPSQNNISFRDPAKAYQDLNNAEKNGQKLDPSLNAWKQSYEQQNNIATSSGSNLQAQVGKPQLLPANKGIATGALNQVAQDYQVGSANKPWPATPQFPGDDRAPDLANERNPNNPLPYGLKTFGEKQLPDGSFEDISGTRMWRDPKGIVKDPKTGMSTSGFVDIEGKRLYVPPPGVKSVDINDQQRTVPGLNYIAVRQPSNDPRRQEPSMHWMEPEKNVINLSGRQEWNVGTTAADREWMKQHPRKVVPWDTEEDYKRQAYLTGDGAQYEAAKAAQMNAKTQAQEVGYNNTNKQAELKLREQGKYGRRPEVSEASDEIWGTDQATGEPTVYNKSEIRKKNAVKQRQSLLSVDPSKADFNNPDDIGILRSLSTNKEYLASPEGQKFSQWLKQQNQQR